MLYFYLKTIHIVVAALIVGLAVVSSLPVVLSRRVDNGVLQHSIVTRWLQINALVVLPLLLIQMVLGFSVISVRQYSLLTPWLVGTFACYFAAMVCWLIAMFQLLQFRQFADTVFYKRWRLYALMSASIVLVMLFLMANKP